MTHEIDASLSARSVWRRVLSYASVLCLTVPALATAQNSPYAASSPLRACCDVDLLSTHGQSIDTIPSVLRLTRNIAGAINTLPGNQRSVRVTAGRSNGSWHRPQDAEAAGEIRASAGGSQALGNWWSTGSATYRRARERNVAWRNGSDAYAGNSYIWADSVGGSYQRDELGLTAGLASPRWHSVSAGLHIDYGLGQGARRNDPRPLFRRRVIELAPGLSVRKGNHDFGIGAIAGWQREDLEIGGGTSADNPVVFHIRGIGTFDRTQLNSASRTIVGGVVGGTAAYAFNSMHWQFATGSVVRLERDSVRDGIALPITGGAARRLRADGLAAARRTRAAGGTELRFDATSEISRGRDPVFNAVNAIDDGSRASMGLHWWNGALEPVSARWNLSSQFTIARLSREDIATETRWSIQNSVAAVAVSRRVTLGSRILTVGASANHGAPRSRSFLSARPSLLTPILAQADFDLLSAASNRIGASIGYDVVLRNRQRMRVSVDAATLRTSNAVGVARTVRNRDGWRLTLEFL
jgi:hypothetical protein